MLGASQRRRGLARPIGRTSAFPAVFRHAKRDFYLAYHIP